MVKLLLLNLLIKIRWLHLNDFINYVIIKTEIVFLIQKKQISFKVCIIILLFIYFWRENLA